MLCDQQKKNLEKLGNIYLDEAKRVPEISNTEFSKREKEKILGLEESMLEISTATPIKKLLYSKQVVDDWENDALTNSIVNRTSQTKANFQTMSATNKMVKMDILI